MDPPCITDHRITRHAFVPFHRKLVHDTTTESRSSRSSRKGKLKDHEIVLITSDNVDKLHRYPYNDPIWRDTDGCKEEKDVTSLGLQHEELQQILQRSSLVFEGHVNLPMPEIPPESGYFQIHFLHLPLPATLPIKSSTRKKPDD